MAVTEKDSSGGVWYKVIYDGYPGYVYKKYVSKVKYYDTYYNLFSINQSDDNVVVGGITYAMKENWNTPYKSLIGGAKFYKNGYIENGQDTYYYKDFNVANDKSNWWHEYAGAINSVTASSILLSYAYRDDAEAKLHFRIPVYKAEPSTEEKDTQVSETYSWKKSGGYWYYTTGKGKKYTGWLVKDGKKYYLNSSGQMLTGWQKISEKWYYFATGNSGRMLTGWQKISKKWYYFGTSGVMVTGTQTIGGKTYTFGSDGVWTGK